MGILKTVTNLSKLFIIVVDDLENLNKRRKRKFSLPSEDSNQLSPEGNRKISKF